MKFIKLTDVTVDKSYEEIMKLPKAAIKKTKEGVSVREKEADLIIEKLKEMKALKSKPVK
jgi:hypothetical protein